MGLLSTSAILLSLACLAALIGLVLAAIFLWPHDRRNEPDDEEDLPQPARRKPADEE